MMSVYTNEGLVDIEDLMLPDSTNARQSKQYVLPHALRQKPSAEQRTFADSVIPGFTF